MGGHWDDDLWVFTYGSLSNPQLDDQTVTALTYTANHDAAMIYVNMTPPKTSPTISRLSG